MRDQIERLRGGLARDTERGWLAGICAGVARYFNIDPAFIRIGVVVAAVFFTKITIAAYVIAWILLYKRRL